MENTTLEMIHVMQKLMNVGSRRTRLLAEKTVNRRMTTNPTCPPVICKAKNAVCILRKAAKWLVDAPTTMTLVHTCAITIELLENRRSSGWEIELKLNVNVLTVTLPDLV
jgi:hypothetical protein